MVNILLTVMWIGIMLATLFWISPIRPFARLSPINLFNWYKVTYFINGGNTPVVHRFYIFKNAWKCATDITRYFKHNKSVFLKAAIPRIVSKDLCANHTDYLANDWLF